MSPNSFSAAVILFACFSFGISTSALAQDDEELDEIVVAATRIEGGGGGRAAATREQLDDSDEIDMEGFFDELEGISTLGGDDEGNVISINGLSPNLSKVTLDGQSLVEGRGNGGFGAGDLPPEMILRVDVYKTPTPAMEEGGAGGRVNLRTRNPVDIPKPTNSIKAKLGYIPDKEDFGPAASVFAARPSASRKFGYMLSVSLSDRDKHFGSQDITSWDRRDFDGAPAYIPTQVRNNAVATDQGDAFVGLTVGFKPHEFLDISSKVFLSRKEKEIENLGLQHRVDRQRDIVALAFDERIVTELESSDDSRGNLRVAGSTRADQVDSAIFGADFDWRREKWRIEGAAGYTTVDNESDTPSQNIVFNTVSAFNYVAAGDGSLIMTYPDGFPENGEFSASRISLSTKEISDTNSFGGLDLTRQLDKGAIRRIKLGAKIREMNRSRRSSKGTVDLDGLLLSDIATEQTQQTPWDTVAWPTIDMEAVDEIVQEGPIEWEDNLLNEFDIKQRSSAGYMQAEFRASLAEERFLVGKFGARLVGTETWIDGYQDLGGGIEPVSLKTRYTDFLPSFSSRMRIAERAGLTVGIAKVMTRPEFNDLAPGIRLNFSDKTAKSGNPNLEPFRANQYLVEVTWAPERGRRLGASVTYRDVSNFTALGEETIEIGDDTFLVTRPVNGGDGSILTASAKLNQNLRQITRALRNVSASASYTYNRSSTDFRDPATGETLPMPNTAEHVVKAGLSYSGDSFAGKLKYNWRGMSLKSSFSESGLSVWNQPFGSLDVNLAWQLNDVVRIGLDGRNLLNEEKLLTTDYDGQLVRINEQDRSLAFNVRANW
jgi:TonB-dependent receptor